MLLWKKLTLYCKCDQIAFRTGRYNCVYIDVFYTVRKVPSDIKTFFVFFAFPQEACKSINQKAGFFSTYYCYKKKYICIYM